MTPTDIATEVADLLEMDSDLDLDVTVYDAAGTQYIIDEWDGPELRGSFLVTIEHYE